MRRRSRSTNTSPPRSPVAQNYPSYTPLRPLSFDLRLLEDRRTFHPLADLRPAATFSSRSQRRIIEKKSSALSSTDPFPSLRLGFAVPKKVAICVRRKQRREALFSKKLTGKGSGSRKRLKPSSKEHC